jgi:hypothetical protein
LSSNLGYDERTIADALGQKAIKMARHYAEGANFTRKMRSVVATFDRERTDSHKSCQTYLKIVSNLAF